MSVVESMPEEPANNSQIIVDRCGRLAFVGCASEAQSYPQVSVPDIIDCGITVCRAVVVVAPGSHNLVGFCENGRRPATVRTENLPDKAAAYIRAITQTFS